MTDQDLIEKVKRLQAECQEALNELAEMKARKKTPEQEAREMLERLGWVYDAQSLSAGDVGEIAQLISEHKYFKSEFYRLARMENPDAVLTVRTTKDNRPLDVQVETPYEAEPGDIFHCYKVTE